MTRVSPQSWTLSGLLAPFASVAVPEIPVDGVCLDSRLVQRGDLYLAVSGATTHGLCYARAAVESGAVAVLCMADAAATYVDEVEALRGRDIPVIEIDALEQNCAAIASRFYDKPDGGMTLIAVTGTDGKTSVCRFIAQSLSACEQPCGYIGTLGWGMGDALQSTQLTTPDEVTLLRLLAELRDQGATAVALEASSHGLAEGRLDGLALDVAVLTNLGRDHLDYHQSIEAYRDAKARLFSWPSLSAVVVNGDDAFGQELLLQTARLKQFACYTHDTSATACNDTTAVQDGSATTPTRVTASHIETADNGLTFSLQEAGEAYAIETVLLGRFNVENLLSCYGSVRACGVSANQACHSLKSVTAVAGRMERFGGGKSPTVVVDYSHTPQALQVALSSARVHCRGKLWVVFGCGGDRDPGKRAPMAAAAEAADHVVLTDDNPRTESSSNIIKDALAGFTQSEKVIVIPDRADAIRHAVTTAQVNDLILIAGKGHEDYQIIGTTRYPFSDRVEAQAALERAS